VTASRADYLAIPSAPPQAQPAHIPESGRDLASRDGLLVASRSIPVLISGSPKNRTIEALIIGSS
jgi:hypothetical protein